MRRFIKLFPILIILGTVSAVFAMQLNAQPNAPTYPQLPPAPSATPTVTMTLTGTVTATPSSTIMPNDTVTPTFTITPSVTPTGTLVANLFLPILIKPALTSLPAPIRISDEPPIDFEAAREDAQAQGMDIAFNKIGFHVGVGGNREGLLESIADLDASSVPVFLKTANDAELLYLTQEMMKVSEVPHTLVYRNVKTEIAAYQLGLPADLVAVDNWQLSKGLFPPELDPSLIWLETINEVGKDHASWLAQFSLAQAQMAVADGYKYAAFSWSPGEPEPEHWELPEMLEFLRYAGDNPDKVAIAIHEYSLQRDFIAGGDIPYPYLVGRFQRIFEVCDKHNIPRPTILITEWGWTLNHVPGNDDNVHIDEAMEDIAWASWLYSAYPQVKGAAIWYLGEGEEFGRIDDEAQQLIAPVGEFSKSTYYVIHPGQFPIDQSLFIPDPPTAIER